MPDIRSAACLAAVALAACSPGNGEQDSAEEPAPIPGETTAPDETAGASLPAEAESFRFAGRWAESVEMCRKEPWTITGERLTAPGGVACDLTRIEETPGGYAIDARCTAEGGTRNDRIVLRFAESAQALLVEGATTLPETGLIRCGKGER